jgi:hypothetical protein
MALAIVVAAALPVFAGQEPRPRAYLLFVDDLHLDFRQTPRTRKLMQDAFARLGKEGDVWSLVTTGTSSLITQATTDLGLIRGAVSRITGNGLKAGAAGAERRQRADVAYKTAVDAITRMAAVPHEGALTVLYISSGYDTRVVDPPSAVAAAAARVGARVVPFQPWFAPQGVNLAPDEWKAYLTATQESLRLLASDTSGVTVFGPDDVEPAMQFAEPPPTIVR